MKVCTDQDLDDVIRVVSPHIPDWFSLDTEDVFLHTLKHPAVVVLMPDDESLCLFIHLGDGEYDMHTIGSMEMTNEAAMWMLCNHEGCEVVSWVPPSNALKRLCRLADRKFGSKMKNGKHYLRKDMICQQLQQV